MPASFIINNESASLTTAYGTAATNALLQVNEVYGLGILNGTAATKALLQVNEVYGLGILNGTAATKALAPFVPPAIVRSPTRIQTYSD